MGSFNEDASLKDFKDKCVANLSPMDILLNPLKIGDMVLVNQQSALSIGVLDNIKPSKVYSWRQKTYLDALQLRILIAGRSPLYTYFCSTTYWGHDLIKLNDEEVAKYIFAEQSSDELINVKSI